MAEARESLKDLLVTHVVLNLFYIDKLMNWLMFSLYCVIQVAIATDWSRLQYQSNLFMIVGNDVMW